MSKQSVISKIFSSNQKLELEKNLLIVIPVYNEQDSLPGVFNEWFFALSGLDIKARFLFIDDGSKDQSLKVLQQIQTQCPAFVEIISHSNRGHGQSCLTGYQYAVDQNFTWVFQIDSDGQCDPRYFLKLWESREKYNCIMGYRNHREDGWKRTLISKVLSLVIFLRTGIWARDANVPFRLMRVSALAPLLNTIPKTMDLANAALTVSWQKRDKIHWVPIGFRNRSGGTPSVRWFSFAIKGLKLWRELRQL